MSSLKMTFSLASLILMFAFLAMPAMAHDTDPATAGDQPDGHVHKPAPTVTSIELVDLMVSGASTVRGSSVVLVEDADAATLALRALDADVANAGEFQIKVTFSDPVYTDAEIATAAGPNDLETGELTITAASQATPGVNLIGAGVSIAAATDIARAADVTTTMDVDESLNTFIITFTVTGAIIGDSDADPAAPGQLPVDVWIAVNADALFSKTGLVNGTDTTGTANAASMREKFTIVKMLPAANARPTLTVSTTAPTDAVTTGSFDIEYTTMDADDDTVTVAATHTVVPSGAMAHYTVDDSVAGTVTVNQAMPSATLMTVPAASVTVTLTPSDSAAGTPVEFTVFFAARTYTAPNQRPTLTISTTAPTDAVTTGSFAVAYTTMDADDDTVMVAATHSVSPSGAMAHYTLDTSTAGTVTVNQAAVSASLMNVPAATVTVTLTPSDAGGAGTARTISIPFGAKAYTPVTDMIAATGYQVLVGPGFNAATLPGVTTVEIANFPDDLAAFFIAGGTIDVVATGGTVRINELMVARDSNKLGALPGEPTDGQWIELRNLHATEAATGVTVHFSTVRPAPPKPTGTQDRLSNVVGQGWSFEGKFGASVLNGSTHATNPVNFISIRRTNYGDGANSGHWGTAVATLLFAPGRVGTPGGKNTVDVFTPQPNDRPIKNQVIISEVANRMNDGTEWIELKGPANKSLKNWQLSRAWNDNGTLKDEVIFNFPGNDNIKISPNGYLLLTDVNPINGELEADFANGAHTPDRYKNAVVTLGALPNGGNFLLILRHRKDRLGSHEGIEDIAGYANNLGVANPFKTLWPLRGNAGVISGNNNLVGGKVYYRVREGLHGYSATANNKLHESAFTAVGFTGLGYDRNAPATAENGGTPGYPHGNFKHNGANAKGSVFISEIMYATGNGGPTRNRNLPQWIEIHNQSDTESVNLTNWRLEIINSERDEEGNAFAGPGTPNKYVEHIGLSGTIPPNQTYLIVSHIASSNLDSGRYRLPPERIRIVGKKFNETLLNPYGFHLTLRANVDRPGGEHVLVDTVGNLNEATSTRRGNDRSFAGNKWELSALGKAVAEDNSRISISRRYGAWSAPMVTATGEDMQGWILTDADKRYAGLIRITYYGRTDDNATPGYTIGAALPVSLSKFRPERLATGEIVVRWITESELNNAGFNILRSETRDGQFTKLNAQLIAGKGTTSERHAYEFVDKTAKPNVVYYYQIQDVSFDGNVTTLQTSRVKGNVTPAGKITTTWGELKALQ